MDRTFVTEPTLVSTSSDTRELYASTIASAAIGVGFAAIVPLARVAPGDMGIGAIELAGVMVASIIVGAGLCLHLSWLANRIGMWRFRAMMLVLGAFAVDAMGAVAWRDQFLAVQFVVGVMLASLFVVQMRLRHPSQSNTASGIAAGAGVVATVFGAPLLFNLGISAGLGMPGSWRAVNAMIAVLVIVAAGVCYATTRPAMVAKSMSRRAITTEIETEATMPAELAAA